MKEKRRGAEVRWLFLIFSNYPPITTMSLRLQLFSLQMTWAHSKTLDADWPNISGLLIIENNHEIAKHIGSRVSPVCWKNDQTRDSPHLEIDNLMKMKCTSCWTSFWFSKINPVCVCRTAISMISASSSWIIQMGHLHFKARFPYLAMCYILFLKRIVLFTKIRPFFMLFYLLPGSIHGAASSRSH